MSTLPSCVLFKAVVLNAVTIEVVMFDGSKQWRSTKFLMWSSELFFNSCALNWKSKPLTWPPKCWNYFMEHTYLPIGWHNPHWLTDETWAYYLHYRPTSSWFYRSTSSNQVLFMVFCIAYKILCQNLIPKWHIFGKIQKLLRSLWF